LAPCRERANTFSHQHGHPSPAHSARDHIETKYLKALLPTAMNAAYVLAVQLLALVTLLPADFGSFSLIYLLFAFGGTLSFSLVSEAWLRRGLSGEGEATWEEYSSVSTYLAIAIGTVAFLLSIAIEPLRHVALVGAIATSTAVYRGTARFYSVRMGDGRGVFSGDLAGLLVTLAVWAPLYFSGVRGLLTMAIVWAAGSVASALFSRRPSVQKPSTTAQWFRHHSAQIRALLGDSLLANSSAIGTPYVLAPILGLADFGIYRAVSNVSAPVRLILAPLAPQLASRPVERQRSPRHASKVIGSSLAFGFAAYVALRAIDALSLDLGALSSLTAFALPTGLFVSANFLGHYFSLIARANLAVKSLRLGRIVYAIIGVVVPIATSVPWGLSGAIWGYTLCAVVSGLLWMFLVVRSASR
jgi:hypothetical protein